MDGELAALLGISGVGERCLPAPSRTKWGGMYRGGEDVRSEKRSGRERLGGEDQGCVGWLTGELEPSAARRGVDACGEKGSGGESLRFF